MNNLYPPFDKGGAEKVVELTYKELRRQGYSPKVVTTKPYRKKIKSPSSDIYYFNSLYYNLSFLPAPIRSFWHLVDMLSLKKYYRIKKILKKEDPDVVITHNLKGLGHLTPRAIKQFSITHFHTLHDIQLLHPSGLLFFGEEKRINTITARFYQKINKFLFRKVDKVISPSQWLLSLHAQKSFFSSSSSQVIYNPLPLSSAPPKKEKSASPDRYTFLYVGQMEEHKGVPLLLQAFQELKEDRKIPSQLKLIGAGNKLTEWGNEIDDTNIFFLGAKSPQEVLQEMEQADCLVVPSLCYENSPTVIYEAIRTNINILASNLGGIPELTQRFYGEIFQPNNKKDLSRKMKNIQYKKRPSIEQKELKEFTPKRYIEKLLPKNKQ